MVNRVTCNEFAHEFTGELRREGKGEVSEKKSAVILQELMDVN